MIPVATALDHVLALVSPLDAEPCDLRDAAGRVLAQNARARRAQPPFPASAMDGYAVRTGEVAVGASFEVIGEAAAGRGFAGPVKPGQAVRIFTGAPMPGGTDYVIIQEDVTREGPRVTLNEGHDRAHYVRAAGADFDEGFQITAPHRLSPGDLALLAAMNVPRPMVTRKPVVAIIGTGDELVLPGEDPGPDQIIASNIFGLKAMLEAEGARARLMPIARDNTGSLASAFRLSRDADLIVTIGGASEGDHDLVGAVAADQGMEQSFYKIAMRPGKPLMAGRMGGAAMVGLPGNPVSALVCGHVFLRPMVRKMLGLTQIVPPAQTATLAAPLKPNGPRAHYMRARLEGDQVTAFDRQDSVLLTVMARANALVIRPPNDPTRNPGETVEVLSL